MSRCEPSAVGKVYLVGAGPGDPGLITVRGLSYLRQAQVVVYDRLVHPALLDEVAPGTECLDVGKVPGQHTVSQAEINGLLIARAAAGHMVVRLKGGDPFVFGRGGEECRALAAAGVPFEVVPGVSSAFAVPAYAGIPVTHRAHASAIRVVTGHTSRAGDQEMPWHPFRRGETLVILMGLRRLPGLVRQLREHGYPPDIPVAVVQWGTTTEQVVVEGTLTDITRKASGLQAPAAIIVGEVVSLRRELQWFDAAATASASLLEAVEPLFPDAATPMPVVSS